MLKKCWCKKQKIKDADVLDVNKNTTANICPSSFDNGNQYNELYTSGCRASSTKMDEEIW